MKRYVYLTLALVLTASMLVGCGCTNKKSSNTSAPTVLPTNEEVWNTTESTARATTASTIPSSTATEPHSTTDRGNGPLEDTAIGTTGSTSATESTGTAAESRARGSMTNKR